MQVVLVLFRSDGERRSFSVVRDITVMGRREDCDLRIPLGDVSRKHCRLIRDDDALRVEDLGSSNGTFINGQRVQEGVVQPGDTLSVGPVHFVVQVDGVPADDELVPFSVPTAEDTAMSGQVIPGEGEPAEEYAESAVEDGDNVVEVPPAEEPLGEEELLLEDEPLLEEEPLAEPEPAAAEAQAEDEISLDELTGETEPSRDEEEEAELEELTAEEEPLAEAEPTAELAEAEAEPLEELAEAEPDPAQAAEAAPIEVAEEEPEAEPLAIEVDEPEPAPARGQAAQGTAHGNSAPARAGQVAEDVAGEATEESPEDGGPVPLSDDDFLVMDEEPAEGEESDRVEIDLNADSKPGR